jgi:hypothetical protein
MFNREAEEAKYTALMEQSNKRRFAEAEAMFINKVGLEQSIKDHIFPCVFCLSTKYSIIGTGFFQHGLWLVSNAHVLPSYEYLLETSLINSEAQYAPLMVAQSFHRPSENPKSPDIVIVNVTSRTNENSNGLAVDFSGDEPYKKSIFFYVYFDCNLKTHIIKHIVPYDISGFPLLYRCEDGTDPQPGCSGSPIIEARVLIARNPKWQFRTIGMVYARCYPNELSTLPPIGNQKLVCSIPVRIDFEQIRREILIPQETALRYREMAQASVAMRDDQKLAEFTYQEKQEYLHAQKNFEAFLEGTTQLDISLPDGLEKLLGNGIIDLKHSMLLNDNQKKYKDKEHKFKNLIETLPDLKNALGEFIIEIQNSGDMALKVGDNFLLSKSNFFRIDVSGSVEKGWKLDLQDNTGVFKVKVNQEHLKDLYPSGTKKKVGDHIEPVSSVFAIVTISQDIQSISGQILAGFLKESLKTKVAVTYAEKPSDKKTKNQVFSLKEKNVMRFQDKYEKEENTTNATQQYKIDEYEQTSSNGACSSQSTTSAQFDVISSDNNSNSTTATNVTMLNQYPRIARAGRSGSALSSCSYALVSPDNDVEHALNLPQQSEIQARAQQDGIPLVISSNVGDIRVAERQSSQNPLELENEMVDAKTSSSLTVTVDNVVKAKIHSKAGKKKR